MTTTQMEINPQLVKQLREKTNAGMMDCKRALAESNGDLEKAEAILRTKGIASASKKSSRATKEGIVASYIHLQGKVGVLVEVNCETDFVAKNENFRAFVKDITLHIAAAHPLYVSREEVPSALIESEREIYKGAGQRQTGKRRRQDCRRETRQVLRHGLPARAGLHQGSRSHHQRFGRDQDRRARREHRHSALHALSRGRATRIRVCFCYLMSRMPRLFVRGERWLK